MTPPPGASAFEEAVELVLVRRAEPAHLDAAVLVEGGALATAAAFRRDGLQEHVVIVDGERALLVLDAEHLLGQIPRRLVLPGLQVAVTQRPL